MDPNNPDEGITSDFEESMEESEFTSITSSRLRYTYEHGRRYQGFLQGRYGLPNDDLEQMREGFKHKLYVDYIHEGQLFLSPIGDYPQKIIDLGTGFGFWAQDVAEKYPSARIIGTDISAIQPSWSPPNIEFRVEDLEDGHRSWTSIYQNADLIYIRAFIPTVRNPMRIIERSFANLRPGGWIEIHEVETALLSDDNTVTPTHPLNILYDLMETRWSVAFGWDLRVVARIPAMLREAGFVNCHIRHNRVPVGRWHQEARMREMGMFSQTIALDLATALLARHEALGLSGDDADALFEDLTEKLDDVSIHGLVNWVDVWAQKPIAESGNT